MYAYGDAEVPGDESLGVVLADMHSWLSAVLAAVSSSPTASGAHEATSATQTTLKKGMLESRFPLEYAAYEQLRRLSRQAAKSAEDDAGVESDEVVEEVEDDLGDFGDGCGERTEPTSVITSAAQRRHFANLRTARMGLEEYERFCARRRDGSLSTETFARWCEGLIKISCTLKSGRPTNEFRFLGWLARCRVCELVEIANRAANGKQLREVLQPLLAVHYRTAAQKLCNQIMVGKDDATTHQAQRLAAWLE
eukprot:CAMPEP_0119303516 /NCGR_PEP_ID=MMETSP1333-20130426/4937_1 /TAXON_ID=418940 /ORGANISM="Scyphosphaera apsteinii, Strain RCC1455" /LENGTH=251 /DNA_ID=CAMNT_0007306215 /DNA_START=58 /DNA_END=814 /DNA_ORIENTATION=+